MSIETTSDGPVTIVTIDRPEVRNAVNRESAAALHEAFFAFDADESAHVAVLTGTEGTFCSGADLKSMAAGDGNAVVPESAKTIIGTVGPMGPTRMRLSKPVIAAVEGHAVAGGLELALWCDLRVAATDAVFGVYCRRWGVPLVDGGTVRLPRLIGQSNANDLILTGRGVAGEEARQMGLANRLTEPGAALEAAIELAQEIAAVPAPVHPQRPAFVVPPVGSRPGRRAGQRDRPGTGHHHGARVHRRRRALPRGQGPRRKLRRLNGPADEASVRSLKQAGCRWLPIGPDAGRGCGS